MPLSHKRDAERKRLLKFQPNSNLNTKPVFQPKPDAPQLKSTPFQIASNARLPLYNPHIHKPGDKVLMRGPTGKLVVIEVPELDEDGNPISGY